MRKTILAMAMLAVVAPTLAIPAVTSVTARQRYPWNGKVDIAYTVTEAFDSPVALKVTATDSADGTTYTADASALSGDTGAETGAHRIVWDLNAQGLEILSDDVAFTVTLSDSEDSTAYAGSSASVRIDSRTGVRPARAAEPLAYSTDWNGSEGCSISIDDTPLLSNATGTGDYVWNAAAEPRGLHTCTFDDGVETLTAAFGVGRGILEVVCPYAGCEPAGTNEYDLGSTVTASAPADFVDGVERRACTGWTGTGSVPASGTGTNCTFTITDDSTLTWQWKTSSVRLDADGAGPLWSEPAEGDLWLPVADGGFRSAEVEAGESSVLETTVSGAGMLSFRWKISANRGDRCQFLTNGVEAVDAITRVADWATVTQELGAGDHRLCWSFEKSASAAANDNAAYLADVCWLPYVSLTVASGDGTPTPAAGTYHHIFGDPVGLSVADPEAVDGTRLVCAGWTGKGSVPASGASNAVDVVLTEDSAITWQWQTQHSISVTVLGEGTSDFGTQWIPAGETAVATIVPSTHLYAVDLLDDTDGVVRKDTTLRIPADRPRAITVRITEEKLSLAVASEYGEPSPAAGEHRLSWETRVNASVAEPEPTNGVRYVCTGWTGTGSVPASGASNAVDVVLTEDSAIAWTWKTNVWISLSTGGPLVASFDSGWIDLGTTFVVDYEPLLPHFDLELTGDTEGVAWNRETQTLAVPADRPRSLALTIAPFTLADALDAPGLVWTTDPAIPWTPFMDAALAADGADAARCAAVPAGGESALATTLSGPGTLAWSWKLDAAAGLHGIDVELDGVFTNSLETSDGWTSATLAIAGEGDHVVRFVFWNADIADGTAADAAYLDQVSWTGAVPEIPGGAFTTSSEVPIAHEWLDRYGLVRNGGYEAAANGTAANGLPVWKCYVADLDPTDPEARFLANIALEGERVVVTWSPDSDERVYVVEGREALDDAAGWTSPTNAASRFFRVKVSLPEGHGEGGGSATAFTPVTLTFDANGGTVDPATILYTARGTLGELPTPTGKGVFLGWYSKPEGGVRFTAESPVPRKDMTLYARWKIQLWEGGPYWAETNIGADEPEDSGLYFWWGDIVGYRREGGAWVASDGSTQAFSFDSENTSTYDKTVSALQSEGWTVSQGGTSVLTSAHDPAHVHWGGAWRMPTQQEFADLNSKCDWTWTTRNGVNGYVVRGRDDYASASIFLPAAGYGYGTSLDNAGSYGRYWSSVPSSDSLSAWRLYFNSSNNDLRSHGRYYGQPVRPVQGFAE